MAQEIILSVVAPDRPGLVDEVASVIAGHGGNWLAASMARLGGQFAGIVQADIPNDQRDAFERAIAGLASKGIEVSLRSEDVPSGSVTQGHMAHLSLTGADHPGIVRDISHTLAEHGVSIEQFHTQLFKGSMSGEALFAVQADMVLPEGLDEAELRGALEDIAGDLLVEIEFKVD